MLYSASTDCVHVLGNEQLVQTEPDKVLVVVDGVVEALGMQHEQLHRLQQVELAVTVPLPLQVLPQPHRLQSHLSEVTQFALRHVIKTIGVKLSNTVTAMTLCSAAQR